MVQADDQKIPASSSGSSSKSSSKAPSKNTSSVTLNTQTSSVGSLCFDLPNFVTNPPIEAVVFGWGVAEDGQLVCRSWRVLLCKWCTTHNLGLQRHLLQGLDTIDNVLSPKVVEALLGTRFRGRQFGRGPLVQLLLN